MQTYEALKIIKIMRENMPEDEAKTIDGQKKAAALEAGIEALRRQMGYPPNLPGYVTLAKTRRGKAKKLLKMRKKVFNCCTDPAFYLTRERYDEIATYPTPNGKSLCSMSPKTCYDKPEPELCGLPVIFGDAAVLGKKVYFVAKKREAGEE